VTLCSFLVNFTNTGACRVIYAIVEIALVFDLKSEVFLEHFSELKSSVCTPLVHILT